VEQPLDRLADRPAEYLIEAMSHLAIRDPDQETAGGEQGDSG
jgi:hypothetical protein